MGKTSTLQYVTIGGSQHGIPIGGAIRNGRNVIRIQGAGQAEPYDLRPGLLSANGTVDMWLQEGKAATLIALAQYTAGVLGTQAINVGYADASYEHSDCVVESLEISGRREEPVRVSLAWQGKGYTEGVGAVSPSPPSDLAYMFDKVTIGLITAAVQGFALRIANTIEIDVALGAYTPHQLVGVRQEITLSLETLAHEALNLGAAAPDENAITITLAKAVGTEVITLAGSIAETQEMPIEEAGTIIHTNTFHCMSAAVA